MVVETLINRRNPSPNALETKEYPLKLLITGASGLLGSKLSELASRSHYEVYSAYSQHRPLYGTPVQLNIFDRKAVEKIFEKVKPKVVVHSAALTDVDKCESERELAWKVNVEGTRNIAESCKRHMVFLIYVSTDYIFNGEKGMYKEDDKPNPINYYGLTKLKGEECVKSLLEDYCIARTSVLYGSVLATGKINFALWVLEKLRNGEKVGIVTDQWNSPTLNTNLANMVLEIVEHRIKGIYHLAGATRINRYDLSQLIAQTFCLNTNLIIPKLSKEISWIARRPKDSSLNIEKAQQTLENKSLKIKQALRNLKKEMQYHCR
jgi:dTDP-4-dehydrorhamnose reductase